MNCRKSIVNNTSELKGCWLFENKKYLYEGKYSNLPTTSLEYKEVLETLGIPYKAVFNRNNEEQLLYWDPNYVEYEEKTGPLYYKYSYGVYKYSGKSYSAKLPTKKMLQMANLKELDVKNAISSYKKLQKARAFLRDQVSCFYTSYHYENYSVNWKGEEIRQLSFSFKTTFGTCYGICLFDMTKIKSNNLDVVTLTLSEHYQKYTGLIIGKEGFRVKEWCQDLGIKKIVVQ